MSARSLRTVLAFLGIGVGFGALVPACGGGTSALCSKICDCEHCNDYKDDVLCDLLDGEAKIAKDYGCDSQFSDWVDCQNGSGVCNAEKATFSSKAPGHCNGPVQNTGMACTTDADCMTAMSSCTGGSCQTKTCGGTMQNGTPCTDDSDCTGDTDLCDTQNTALQSCIQNAAADRKNDYDIGTD